ncbi:unnamed protein product [Moneuplotes crassus]|uniref:Uncharacterized protein n=1 Tax=Euplotes crassus TaxID=5936 RepID=A0AAD1XZ69_EUPCR|nr:unnamed protein product [Moneuplotes crassus]
MGNKSSSESKYLGSGCFSSCECNFGWKIFYHLGTCMESTGLIRFLVRDIGFKEHL